MPNPIQRYSFPLLPTNILAVLTWAVTMPGAAVHSAEPTSPQPNASPPPNIVLMMADDMGLGDTSAYQDLTGNDDRVQIHTPSMERLARRGIRFSDAHSTATRCTNTRYGLLTGRYAWRSRMKHWVLFGAQGDPLIEADRPTIATMLRDAGYRTAMVGKWHVGLRYLRSDGSPAAGFEDADLTQPLYDGPLDHGFDVAQITSRSHGTSGTQPQTRRNRPDQTVGPGHIDGRQLLSATSDARRLADDGPDAYVLDKLGSRHSDNAIRFLDEHLEQSESRQQPFFLYYASNSNHKPYTPDEQIGEVPVAGAGRNVAGDRLDNRADFVFENDVALGRLIDFLASHDDPRNENTKLIENTMVIFTSDNGAEIRAKAATGPFRSNKGSAYEAGHRVPFLVTWAAGNVGDGDASTPGKTSHEPIALHDLFATFADIVGAPLPDPRRGEKGAEDSHNVLAAWQGGTLPSRPQFHNDHKEADDRATSAIRLDNPVVDGTRVGGNWKLFFDAALLRHGQARPTELYELDSDPEEQHDRLADASLQPLVEHLTAVASLHRNAGGHRLAPLAGTPRVTFDWRRSGKQTEGDHYRVGLAEAHDGRRIEATPARVTVPGAGGLAMQMHGAAAADAVQPAFAINPRGLGISGGAFDQVESGEAIEFTFDQDVIVESAAIVAGNGKCGGFCRMGDKAPLAIYCIDADNDGRDQSGRLSDLGVLKAGQTLRFDSAPHFGVEPPGQWRLGELTVRLLRAEERQLDR